MANATDQAIIHLSLVAETCTVSIAVLSASSPSNSPANLSDIHGDIISLLSLIYQSATKLAIALNPADPTYQASISVLKELAQHIHALTSCASRFNSTTHGQTLRSEVIHLVTDVLQSLNALAKTFLAISRGGPSSVPRGEYLTRTGTVHSLIDKARGPNGLSADNLQAVRKRWAEDRRTLDDAYSELSEIIEDTGADPDDDFLDDGLDELGLGPSKKLTPAEVERVKKVQSYLRVTTMLHKRVLLDLLSTSASPQQPASLDKLVKISSDFLSATDEVVATLYGPQEPSTIPPALRFLANLSKTLQQNLLDNNLIPPKQPLEKRLNSMSIQTGAPKKSKDIGGWFETCFTQIDKLCTTLSETFNNN